MSIYIKGMDLPKEGKQLRIVLQPDGSISEYSVILENGQADDHVRFDDIEDDCIDAADGCDIHAQELPPQHGDLIDARAFRKNMDYVCDAGGWLQPVTQAVTEYVKKQIGAQDVVIESEN